MKDTKAERASQLVRLMDAWLGRVKVDEFVKLFGGTPCSELPFSKRIDHLADFGARTWDYRQIQSQGAARVERWETKEDDFVRSHHREIDALFAGSGIADETLPEGPADVVVIFGAKAAGTFRRVQNVHDLIGRSGIWAPDRPPRIIALTGRRPLYPDETCHALPCDSSVNTEFDFMNAALVHVFDVRSPVEGVEFGDDAEMSEMSDVRVCRFQDEHVGVIQSWEVAGSIPGRRPDTRSTFETLVRHASFPAGSTLLFQSSHLSTLYQFLCVADLAIQHDIGIECVGCAYADPMTPVTTHRCLQELGAQLIAMRDTYQRLDARGWLA